MKTQNDTVTEQTSNTESVIPFSTEVPADPSGFASSAGTPAGSAEPSPSMASSVTRHAQNPLSDNFQFLVSGIDSLDLGLNILWNHKWPKFKSYLDQKKQEAMEKNGVLDRTPHEVEFVHLPTGKAPNYRYHLQFPEYHLFLSISEKAHKSPNGYLSINSEALWKGSISHLLESVGIDLHHYGGTIERIQISRVDLCADYRIPGGITLDFLERHRVSRANETTFHLRHNILETYYVGSPSAPVRLRVYDKGKEIQSKGKKFWFTDIWKVDDITDVWRVEFQMRRQFLRQFQINTLEDLWQKIGGVWSYLTTEWISFRHPDNDRTARRTVLPWWEHIQQAGNLFNTSGSVQRYSQDDMLAPVEWYVSHVAGCLASVAARMNIEDCREAVKVLGDNLEGHWKEKDFRSEVKKRSLRLGRVANKDERENHEEPSSVESASWGDI
jgi:hypothetical protein